MRISTSQIYGSGYSGIMNNQADLVKLQNQMSSGKKILSAKDDPVGAAQVLLNSQSLAVTTQYADNQGAATDQLALEEGRLQSVVDSIQYIREQVVSGGNASYSDSERKYIAENLQSQFDYLLDLANSADAGGYYLFSGFQGNTQPFQLQANGSVAYMGDDGERSLQVSSSESVAVSDSGSKVFERIRTGNGTFALSAASSNSGTGVASNSSVNNPASWTGNEYSIAFSVSGGATTYTVTNVTTGATVANAQPYTAGSTISFDGVSLSISGTPANTDTFSVKPSASQSIFTTLKNLISAFSTNVNGNSVAAAAQRNIINTEMLNIDSALDNSLSVQASIGSRSAELSALSTTSSALKIQYENRITSLQSVDYAEVISNFYQTKLQLDAAQAAFAKVSGLSLFNYL